MVGLIHSRNKYFTEVLQILHRLGTYILVGDIDSKAVNKRNFQNFLESSILCS